MPADAGRDAATLGPVENAAIARALEDLADLQELSGIAVFKERAFRGAARAIERLGEAVADLVKDGKLVGIRGVGMASRGGAG